MSNWYFECPFCGDEVDCSVYDDWDDNRGSFVSVEDVPEDCPNCKLTFNMVRHGIIEDIVDRYTSWFSLEDDEFDDDWEEYDKNKKWN